MEQGPRYLEEIRSLGAALDASRRHVDELEVEVDRLRARLAECGCPEPEDEPEYVPPQVEGVASVKGPQDVAPPPPRKRKR